MPFAITKVDGYVKKNSWQYTPTPINSENKKKDKLKFLSLY